MRKTGKKEERNGREEVCEIMKGRERGTEGLKNMMEKLRGEKIKGGVSGDERGEQMIIN